MKSLVSMTQSISNSACPGVDIACINFVRLVFDDRSFGAVQYFCSASHNLMPSFVF